MLAWRNLRNIGFVTQAQYQQEMEIKRPEIDAMYQLESENSSSEEEEVPVKSKRRVLAKKSKSKRR